MSEIGLCEELSMDAIDYTLANIRADRQLHYENYQLGSFVQALCGFVTLNMVAVSMHCIGEEVHVYFYLEHASEADNEAIEEVIFELEALQFALVPLISHISVVGASINVANIEGRAVYRRYVGTP